jgi:ring-1,2-phenylacetyl-CoA epoxidase subunit PaaE
VSSVAGHPADRIARIPDPREPIPLVALPTLALLVGGLGVWAGSTALAVTGTWPWPISVALNAAASFVLFTVSHDAAHNAVSSNATVTSWMGRLATVLFAPHAGFRTWRFIHMQHHRFTNHDDGSDPDTYTHTGPRWQLPLRWLTVDLHYMRFYLPRLAERPRAERLELFATWAVVVAASAALIATGNGLWLVVLYFLPIRLAVLFLAWSFDFLPHHGLEDHTPKTNRFRATRNRVGAEWLISPLLLNQNYHLVHHLHPVIPFYRYLRVWRRSEEAYLAHDPELSDVRGRPLTTEEYRRLREMADSH